MDVIIPTYKPDRGLLELLNRLERQTLAPEHIIIMNTEQKYFDRLVYGTAFPGKYPNVTVRHLSKREFDHGRTRNQGVRHSRSDRFVMMTQDALPADEFLLEALDHALDGEKVAAAYARQLPAENCGEIEKFTRQFNYPDAPAVKTEKDIPRLGVKTFFCSNVCAAYRRELFDSLGGFVGHAIFNEDMIYAAGAVKAGCGIAYVPAARVYHSHNYTNSEQFHRNFDIGVSQADHPEVFEGLPPESEGIRLVRETAEYLRRNHKSGQIPHLLLNSACKYAGYLLGKHYRSLPAAVVRKCTMSREYWEHRVG